MGFPRLSFTERRRRTLAKKSDRLDQLEPRTTMTEPISFTGLSITAISSVVRLGIVTPFETSNAPNPLGRAKAIAKQTGQTASNSLAVTRTLLKPLPDVFIAADTGSNAGAAGSAVATGVREAPPTDTANDWLTLNTPPSQDDAHGISTPWRPTKQEGGGPTIAPRGGVTVPSANASAGRGAITPLRLPSSPAAASNAGGASAALLAAVAGSESASPGGAGGAAAASNVALAHAGTGSSSGQGSTPGQGGTITPDGSGPTTGGSGGSALPGSTPYLTTGNSSGASEDSFAYFSVYVLDNNDGVVLYPGVEQLATLDAKMELIAQVSGATVSSYSWNTTSLSNANDISGTSTNTLTWQWTNNVEAATTSSVTLSVTDSSSQVETFTYDFWLPVGSNTISGGSNATWPTSWAPSSELDSAPSFSSVNGYASVDALSGSLDTEIDLPTYNPNIPGLALTYDSVAASPEPMITVENTIGATVPTKVSGQLTFDGGTPLTTYYYGTSTLNAGDVQQINLEATNATSLSTGRYTYSAQVVDIGSSNVTTTYSGSTDLLNYSGSAFGAGWTLQGLERIYSESGGVILDLGDDGRTLWFASSGGGSGGSYTDPAGEFSTLVANSGGGWTDTLTNGDKVVFNSGGYETETIDTNNNIITYAYDASHQLTTISDYLGNNTVLSYSSGGYLQSITDPAGRITTITNSGGNLTEAELPDGSTWNYAYSSGGQLTKMTDPNSNVTTIVFDSAGRVGTITSADNDSEKFTNDQESGWTNSGTSGSPAAATLLAQAGGTYTSPNGNLTTIQPNWTGLGVAGNVIDPLGNVQLFDTNSNGLPTITVDQDNLNTHIPTILKGSVTGITYMDGNSVSYQYNSFQEPTLYTNEENYKTTYTYNADGDLTVTEDRDD